MSLRRILLLALVIATPLAIIGVHRTSANGLALTPMEQLGKSLFFDTNLSTPPGVSCASCHGPAVGFTGPISKINATTVVYPGAVHTRFGNRKPPSAAYAGTSPVFYYDSDEGVWVGGMFWDGRATGATLGDPLAEQAQGPFLNPLEQNDPHAKQVCVAVMHSAYATLFRQVWGPASLDCVKDVSGTYERIARSISAYEKSSEVNPFSSKFDYYLEGQVELTEQEAQGYELFTGERAKCSGCHIADRDPSGGHPLFTDFTYDNLGVPKNPANPFYSMPRKWNPLGPAWIDLGLGGFLSQSYPPEVYESELGKVKVPTLRNVDLRPWPGFVKAYAHNGYFKSLKEIVHFYNTRDVLDACVNLANPNPGVNCWPAPEFAATVNHDELGDLGLTPEEEDAIVAFMKSLSDGYVPPSD
jgi:cytochrome c peroxidase